MVSTFLDLEEDFRAAGYTAGSRRPRIQTILGCPGAHASGHPSNEAYRREVRPSGQRHMRRSASGNGASGVEVHIQTLLSVRALITTLLIGPLVESRRSGQSLFQPGCLLEPRISFTWQRTRTVCRAAWIRQRLRRPRHLQGLPGWPLHRAGEARDLQPVQPALSCRSGDRHREPAVRPGDRHRLSTAAAGTTRRAIHVVILE